MVAGAAVDCGGFVSVVGGRVVSFLIVVATVAFESIVVNFVVAIVVTPVVTIVLLIEAGAMVSGSMDAN